ncbi:MAG: CidA/LrgA family protein [Janthinobacterium lividum]
MAILRAFLTLLLAQLAGEALHRVLHLPLPGPVIGMALLAAVLLWRGGEPDAALVETSDTLLRWLGLLFVPAGVGVFSYVGLLRAGWLPIVAALVLSTVLTFAVTGWVMQALWRKDRVGA